MQEKRIRPLLGAGSSHEEGLLTSTDGEPGSRAPEPIIPAGFGDNRRMVPFFDVRLPKGWAFTSGSDGLLPHSLLGDGNIPSEKEVEDDVHLISDGKQGSHWGANEWEDES